MLNQKCTIFSALNFYFPSTPCWPLQFNTNQFLWCASSKTALKSPCSVRLFPNQGATTSCTVRTVKNMGKIAAWRDTVEQWHLEDHLNCAMQIITGDRPFSQCLATAVTGVKNRSALYQHYRRYEEGLNRPGAFFVTAQWHVCLAQSAGGR